MVVDKVMRLAVRPTIMAAARIVHSTRRKVLLGSAIEAGEFTTVAGAAAKRRAMFVSDSLGKALGFWHRLRPY